MPENRIQTVSHRLWMTSQLCTIARTTLVLERIAPDDAGRWDEGRVIWPTGVVARESDLLPAPRRNQV